MPTFDAPICGGRPFALRKLTRRLVGPMASIPLHTASSPGRPPDEPLELSPNVVSKRTQ